jgi:hypothetical protein
MPVKHGAFGLTRHTELNREQVLSVQIVRDVVETFLKQERNEVLAIKGAWGVGKTHAWHQLVTEFKLQIRPTIYSYVSLFGIASIAELRMAILSNSRPTKDVGSRVTLESIKQNWKTHLLAKVNLFKQKLPGFEGGSVLKDVFITLDAFTPSLVSDRLICFDDFERLSTDKLSHDTLMGFISTLKETANCKVAIILNDAQVPKEQATYQTYREKVIDREIQFNPTVDEAIGWALGKDTPYSDEIADCARKLQIKNVRILRKVANVVSSIEPAIKGKHPGAISLAIHSAVLLTWCYYDKTGQGPSLDFVKNTTLLSSVKGRNKKEDKPEVKPEEAQWAVTLGLYKFLYYDDFDAAVVKVIEQGYLEGSGFEAAVISRDSDLRKGDLRQQFIDAWSLFHNSFADNEKELVEALTKTFEAAAHQEGPSTLDAVVTLLRDLDQDERADQLIQHYMRVRSHEPAVFDLDQGFGRDVSDKTLRAAFAVKLAVVTETVSLRAAVEHMVTSNGWTAEQMGALFLASADDLYQLFKGPTSVPVSKIVTICQRFNQPPNEHIAERTQEALLRLGKDCRLNRIRLRSYGLKVDDKGDLT